VGGKHRKERRNRPLSKEENEAKDTGTHQRGKKDLDKRINPNMLEGGGILAKSMGMGLGSKTITTTT